MPCYDSRNEPAYVRREILSELQPALDRLKVTTALACQFCHLLELKGREIPDYAQHWWREHKLVDAARGEHDDQMPAL